jgi:sulfur-oxidizing protein SoxA
MRAGLAGLLLIAQLASGPAVADDRRSGFDFMSRETQALQRDDDLNPAMLWARGGEIAWSQREGRAAKSCADCHGTASASMRGVAARHPAFDAASGQVLTLAGRINACRVRQQKTAALAPESEPLLSLTAHVAMASRGLPVAPPDDARLAPLRAQGQRLFQQRLGQLDLSCAQCHDALAGRRLGGSTIPQAHPTGYPLYRLEWQGLGSLQRRLRGCFSGVRAEAPPFDHADLVALELFLMQRAAGLPMESPAVRP